MPAMDAPLEFRSLADRDVAAAVALSTQAGWNQLAADWGRLVSLWPANCLCGLADGLVATGTLATFDAPSGPEPKRATGWIGMILVDERCRGRGTGTAMMRKLLQTARAAGLAGVGLDATDMGRPVYEKLGFRPHSAISRWIGRGRPATQNIHRLDIHRLDTNDAQTLDVRPLRGDDWAAVAALDRSAVGVIRLPLLRQLAGEPGAAVLAAFDRGRLVAFGLARAGRTARAIGPIVAEYPAAAAAVLPELLFDPVDPGQGTALIDVPEGAPLEAALQEAGFVVQRRLTRMLLPLEATPAALVSPLVHAAAGFELG